MAAISKGSIESFNNWKEVSVFYSDETLGLDELEKDILVLENPKFRNSAIE